jgi:hypothetical protein
MLSAKINSIELIWRKRRKERDGEKGRVECDKLIFYF